MDKYKKNKHRKKDIGKNKEKCSNEKSTESSVPKQPLPEAEQKKDEEATPEEVFDFSHLKRETEKIKELSKKSESQSIISNWAKYESVIITDPEPEQEPSEFEILVHTPRSDGGHFQFKSEKSWSDNKPSKWGKSDLFNLDLNVLLSGLACIPFYERNEIDKNILTAEDVEKCDYFAMKSRERYKTIEHSFKNKLQTFKLHITEEEKSEIKNNISQETELKQTTGNSLAYSEVTDDVCLREVTQDNLCSSISIPRSTSDEEILLNPEKGEPAQDISPKEQRVRKKQSRTNLPSKTDEEKVVHSKQESKVLSVPGEVPVPSEAVQSKEVLHEPQHVIDPVKSDKLVQSDDENLEDWLDSVLDD